MSKKFIRATRALMLINLATITMPTLSMDLPQKTTIWQSIKQSLKSERAIIPACYILFIGHAAKEMFKFFNHGIHTDKAYWDNQKNTSDLVCNFVHTTLQENGVPQETIDTITIKNNEHWKAAYHHICVPNNGIETLLSATETDEYPLITKISYINWHIANFASLKWPINTCKQYVLHEYGHVLNNEIQNSNILQRLFLNDNNLLTICANHFLPFIQLKELNLSKNSLMHIDLTIFQHLAQLEYLAIEKNNITVIDPTPLQQLNRLRYFIFDKYKLTKENNEIITNVLPNVKTNW